MSSVRINSKRFMTGIWFFSIIAITLLLLPNSAMAQDKEVRVVADNSGTVLKVGGEDFMVFGMNWDYFPVGENYAYSLWNQPDELIEAALEREMSLLKSMGVNAIRQYVGVTPRWVKYIYENYGIWTVLNHSLGRYGITLNGVYIQDTDYSDPQTRAAITAEVIDMVNQFKDTPGVLMWLLGNENNYGLVWTGAETENLPEGERQVAKARYLYSLFGEVAREIKKHDTDHPVSMANGDLQYIDIIAEECEGMDVFGTNVYRGISFGDLFQEVKDKLDIPVMFTEFGADAFDAKKMREDQITQARYLLGQWQEIYEQSAGKGLVGNSIGGLTFQWSDGWWKYLQDSNLDKHDINASWGNDAYPEDYSPGDNNMNEEWWGVCAKGPTDSHGLFELYPRAAFYALQDAYKLDPYGPNTDIAAIQRHFASIQPGASRLQSRADEALLVTKAMSKVRISNVQMKFETFSTGGSNISTPSDENPQLELPSFLGFDHLQSFFAEVEANPNANFNAKVSFNILGNVPVNPIDEVFYENRGRRRTVEVEGEPFPLQDIERVKVYNASVSWDDRWFTLDGFYRTGHTHWGYEGDFFGVYRNAFYGKNIDIYNGVAPIGIEVAGKRSLKGLKVAFGPELWWGANPAFILKYRRQLGKFDVTALYQNEFSQRNESVSSIAVPLPATRRATLAMATDVGPFGLTLGGIWSGSALVDETFQVVEEGSNRVLEDRVKGSDTFGGKVKLTWEKGRWHWYGQYAYAGIVANSGPDATITYTGWRLKDHGLGNGNMVTTGLAANFGTFQIAPNFLWQKPLVGPIPADVMAPGRPRNVIEDPFAVRGNREQVAAEILLTHDPTPADWMWAWDNDLRESASLAWSLGFEYRHFPTTMDAAIGILQDGRTFFAFPGATPARDLWEARARIVSRVAANQRLVMHVFGGTGEPNGDDTRLIRRYGGDARYTVGSMAFEVFAKFGDWGSFDYHRDFNLTFPAHLGGDVSYNLGTARWFGLPQTRIGVRGAWRSLDQNSNRYCPVQVLDAGGNVVCDPTIPGAANGNEWEVRTYLHVSL